MTSAERLSTIQSIYNKRAPTYDSEGGFHPLQAADYIKWMNLSPGLHVLDLACGTGAITIPAAKTVGPLGRALGVDISGDSLAIARAKAAKDSLNAKFIQHDVAALHEIKEIEEDAFDVITCGSAFVVLENPEAVVKGWAKLLKKGGKMIFDVPSEDSMIAGYVLDTVGKELGIPMIYDRKLLDSSEKVKELLTSAGLDPSDCFTTASYRETELIIENAAEIFDSTVGNKEWFGGVYAGFTDPTVKDLAKELFCNEMNKLADADGKIKEQLRFIMGVGKRT